MDRIQRGEMAQGGGWLARGARLVEETGYDGVEPGFLLIPQALQALMGGRPADAFAIFERSPRSPSASTTRISGRWAGSVAVSRSSRWPRRAAA